MWKNVTSLKYFVADNSYFRIQIGSAQACLRKNTGMDPGFSEQGMATLSRQQHMILQTFRKNCSSISQSLHFAPMLGARIRVHLHQATVTRL